ncbi:MAG: restriction endonuclease subunit M, partial [Bacteroidota bacterium]
HPKNRRILTTGTLNECVQRILDRIVFLRVCEDRNIDPDQELLALLRLWESHPGLSLYELFTKLIEKKRPLYNGLLFADHESEQLEVGNKILEKIFKSINYPLSPYNFDEIGVEILGSIYERFLGKTIRLTAKQVRVEEKPEVRKAGGVYYTPQYIVNYIVENTVGRLLRGECVGGRVKGIGNRDKPKPLTTKQISKLRIIDIACGSGS